MIDEGEGIMAISEKDVLDCGLFFYDRKRDCLRMERVRIHETSGDIYISEKVFNAIWPSIRGSILIGIELAPEDAENVAKTPEDIYLAVLTAVIDIPFEYYDTFVMRRLKMRYSHRVPRRRYLRYRPAFRG